MARGSKSAENNIIDEHIPILMHLSNRIFLSVLSVCASVSFSVGALASTQDDQIRILRRLVVMDGACAWPQLTVLPNGDIAALIWPYPNHGHHEGAAESWVSSDHGLIWTKAGVPVMNTPGVARLNVAGGMAADGNYIALVSGWAEKPTIANVANYMPPKMRLNAEGPVVARSADFGRTWHARPDQLFQQADGKNLIAYGRISSVGGVAIGVMCYLDDVLFYASEDNGASWKRRGVVSTGRAHNESTWLRLMNGELYAAARRWDGGGVDGFRSLDGGKSWRLEGRLTLPRQHPADITQLRDGKLLLSYSSRNDGSWAIWIRLADETGSNWGPPMLLVDLQEADDGQAGLLRRDGGYPSTVIAEDGTLVTAYYSKGNSTHQRYHVGIVKWRLSNLGDVSGKRDAR